MDAARGHVALGLLHIGRSLSCDGVGRAASGRNLAHLSPIDLCDCLVVRYGFLALRRGDVTRFIFRAICGDASGRPAGGVCPLSASHRRSFGFQTPHKKRPPRHVARRPLSFEDLTGCRKSPQDVIASDRRERGDLSCSMKRRDCFVASLLAMTTLRTFFSSLLILVRLRRVAKIRLYGAIALRKQLLQLRFILQGGANDDFFAIFPIHRRCHFIAIRQLE
jgi:hypothetical protein